MQQQWAQIYKVDFRESNENEDFRTLSVFKDVAFGIIAVFNDVTLAPQKSILILKNDKTIVLLPLVGGIEVNGNFVKTEEILVSAIDENLEISNPYETELVNFLQLELDFPTPFENKNYSKKFDFNLRNSVKPIYKSEKCIISIGIFDGRKEAAYVLENKNNNLFAFVINGAFEFENRLLESRDALALKQVNSASFEALSENAIVLILEISD